MAQVLPKVLLRSSTPQLQFLRFRGKINIQRPKAPGYEKARLIAATRITLPKPVFNQGCIDLQNRQKVEETPNPYSVIIAREVRNWFDHSKMICIFHTNPIRADDFFNAAVAFHKQNMKLKVYGRKIMKLAIGGSKYEALLPLFDTKFSIVFSPEIKVKEVIKIMKKAPQFVLLAAVAHDRYLNRNEFEALATMPDLQGQRAQFAALLNSFGGQIVNNLQMHQTQLCSLLDLHAQGSGKEENEAKPEVTKENEEK